MLRFVVAALLLAAAAVADAEEFQVTYELPPPGHSAVMNVSVDRESNVINSVMEGNDEFEPVEILEDYDTGFGATRVISGEICYIRKLQYATLNEQATFLKNHETVPLNVESTVQLISVEYDNEDEFGERLVDFCKDFPIYKIGTGEDGGDVRSLADVREEEASERTITITFRKCALIFFFPVCTVTSLVFPTGYTITFVWFFWG